MNNYRLTFQGDLNCSLNYGFNRLIIILTMDGFEKKEAFEFYSQILPDKIIRQELPFDNLHIPKRVMRAFTSHALDRILSIDKIPNPKKLNVLDGLHYVITIQKGEIEKIYTADDAEILSYPLLRYIASWYRQYVDKY